MSKKEQRQKLMAVRNKLSQLQIEEKSRIIKEKLLTEQKFIEAKTILVYIDFNNEVRTKSLIKEMLSQDKRVIVPITNQQEKKLYLSELRDFDNELTTGTYGILEPKAEYRRLIEAEKLDLIIAPGVGFDEQCNRIGYGGGYYDRLLALVPEVPVIALAFIEQIVKQIKTSRFDQKVDKIITDQKIIEHN